MKETLYNKGKISIYSTKGVYELNIGDINEPEDQEPFIFPEQGIDEFIGNPSELEKQLNRINPLIKMYLEREEISFPKLCGAFNEAKEERDRWRK